MPGLPSEYRRTVLLPILWTLFSFGFCSAWYALCALWLVLIRVIIPKKFLRSIRVSLFHLISSSLSLFLSHSLFHPHSSSDISHCFFWILRFRGHSVSILSCFRQQSPSDLALQILAWFKAKWRRFKLGWPTWAPYTSLSASRYVSWRPSSLMYTNILVLFAFIANSDYGGKGSHCLRAERSFRISQSSCWAAGHLDTWTVRWVAGSVGETELWQAGPSQPKPRFRLSVLVRSAISRIGTHAFLFGLLSCVFLYPPYTSPVEISFYCR